MHISYKKCFNPQGEMIQGPLILNPKINTDERGFFLESWNKKNFNKILSENGQKAVSFVQDNHSKSTKGTLRGLHFQKRPYSQGKLVRCLNGEIYDVAVDLRKDSKTFLHYTYVYLNNKNHTQFWIPEGFAHGFLTLSDKTEVLYKTTQYWNKKSELSLMWNDPEIKINWPTSSIKNELNISEKDKDALFISQIKQGSFFL